MTTGVIETPTQQPRSARSAWFTLALTPVTFILGAIAQLAVFFGLGLCTEADVADCSAGTVPTTWETVLATVPTYLLWIGPAVVAVILGIRSMRSGNSAGRTVAIVSGAALVVITVACAAMWWL
jgi:hypothetical protein